MNRRSVLIVHHSGLLGGAGRSLVDVVRALEGEYEVTVCIPGSPPEMGELLTSEGIPFESVGFRMAKVPYYSGGESLWHPRFWFYVMCTIWQWRYWQRFFDRVNPDAVVLNSSVLAWLALVLTRERVRVLMVRETLQGSPMSITNRLLRKLRERFDVVTYLSEYDRVQDGLRCPRAIVCRDAAVPRDFVDKLGRKRARRMLGIDARVPVALFLGGSNRLKGLDLVLDAMKVMHRRDCHLVVGGAAPRPPGSVRDWFSAARRFDGGIVSRLRRGALRSRVDFVGARADVSTLYSAADFVVFPMKRPHQARPAFEAGFQGKSVIATGFANVQECVVHGENGLTFTPGSHWSLASCMDRLVRRPRLAEQLGERNRLHAYSMHDHRKVYSVLREVLAEELLRVQQRPAHLAMWREGQR